MKRRPIVLALALICAFLAGGALTALAKGKDPCERLFTRNSVSKLQDYVACREDRQDAALKRIESRLATMAPTTRPTSNPSSPKPTTSASPSATGKPGTGGAIMQLPRVAWEGGPGYWKQFKKADRAG
ncbi:hypothetical protein, partial [Microlunatus ginsengisoli]|uniref:hypothetical protein n=1 Tax=Microlunatus ginsengisoli TaxID=363863 RepID=UPI0031E2BB6E